MDVITAIAIALAAASILFWSIIFRKNVGYPPGPWGLPIFGHLHLLGDLPHQSLFKLAQKHGPVMMIKMGLVPTVVISSALAAKEVFSTHDVVFASRPQLTNARTIMYNARDMGWSEYGPYWRLMKKLCTVELFTARRMEQFSSIRLAEVSSFVKTILVEGGEGSAQLDMNNRLSKLNMNVISMVAFQKRLFGSDRNSAPETEEDLVGLLQKALDMMGVFIVGDYIPFLRWLDPQRYVKKMKSIHRRLDAKLQVILDEHKRRRQSETGSSPDLVDVLLSIEEVDVDDDSTKAMILDMLAGGADTSSITTEWALSELIHNPSCMVRVQEEADRVVGRDQTVSEADLCNLRYLQAVVKETFRLHPPLPLLVPHKSTAGCEVNGHFISAQSTLYVNAWAIGRDPAFWDSPEAFDPQRFLGAAAAVGVKGQDFQLIPFGSGRRMCPGMPLGLCMVELTLARLVHGFDWRVNGGRLSMDEVSGITLRRKDPLKAFAAPRLAAHLYND